MLTLPELWFAFFYDTTDSFGITNTSHRWFDRHVRPNSAGYRDDRELPTTREAGVTYVGFVGDSFTFGHGVKRTQDRFSDRVARELDAVHPGRTQVFNASLPGVDIRSLADALVPELFQADTPTDILVYTFVPNDIESLDERTGPYYQSVLSGAPTFFLFRDTYFYNWLYVRCRGLRPMPGGNYYDYLADAYTGPAWSSFAERLDRLQRRCAARGIEFRVVIFPFLTNLGGDDPFQPAYDRIVAHCRDAGIPCLDLRPVLTQHKRDGLIVNRFDPHPNERAHELAARAILEDLAPVVAERIGE